MREGKRERREEGERDGGRQQECGRKKGSDGDREEMEEEGESVRDREQGERKKKAGLIYVLLIQGLVLCYTFLGRLIVPSN